jgi:hypothetical protein
MLTDQCSHLQDASWPKSPYILRGHRPHGLKPDSSTTYVCTHIRIGCAALGHNNLCCKNRACSMAPVTNTL